MPHPFLFFFFFFFNDTATTEIYTLSLHDALPISRGFAFARAPLRRRWRARRARPHRRRPSRGARDRKSTRLNSSHLVISYAVFCLKKKKKKKNRHIVSVLDGHGDHVRRPQRCVAY